MKIMTAVKLVKSLPNQFNVLKDELQSDLSDAYFNPETKYEDIIEGTEIRIKERGLFLLYSETNIPKNKMRNNNQQKQKRKIKFRRQ